MTERVHYAVDRGIATLTLDSPDDRNALSAQLVGETMAHLDTAVADPGVRAVVVTHTGGTFCSGADLKESVGAGGPAVGTLRLVELLRAVLVAPKPVVGALDGHVRAGGIGLLGACDIVLAGPSSTFAFSEVRLGLAPSIISLTTLGRMSERTAARYYLTGETFGPAVAVASGLITASPENLAAELSGLAAELRRCSPQGLAESKALTTARVREQFDRFAADRQALSTRLFASAEAQEGMRSFLERRPPAWVTPTPS